MDVTADFGAIDFKQLKDLQKNINRLKNNKEKFLEACVKELAARLLAKVKKRTPVGWYGEKIEKVAKRTSKYHIKGEKYYVHKGSSTGENGGTLRRGWEVIGVHKSGNNYIAVVKNPVEYASYVEYGHRQTPGKYIPTLGKRLVKSWVPGKFMLTVSEKEIEQIAPQILKQKLDDFLGGMR